MKRDLEDLKHDEAEQKRKDGSPRYRLKVSGAECPPGPEYCQFKANVCTFCGLRGEIEDFTRTISATALALRGGMPTPNLSAAEWQALGEWRGATERMF